MAWSPPLEVEEIDLIKSLSKQGLNQYEIADRVNRPQGTISRVLRREVIIRPPNPKARPCERCGKPTIGKFGICARTPECKLERERKARQGKDYVYAPTRYCARCGSALYTSNAGYYCMTNDECIKLHFTETHAQRMFMGKKSWANRNGVPFNLTMENLPPMPEFCPALGLKLTYNTKRGQPDSPSLDRIIPDLGYTVGNVQWLSYKANTMKNNASPEYLVTFGKWALRTFMPPEDLILFAKEILAEG